MPCDLATAVAAAWTFDGRDDRFVLLTGGEPLRQISLSSRHCMAGLAVAVETNGTLTLPHGL
jgi:organic radical activating enzyme